MKRLLPLPLLLFFAALSVPGQPGAPPPAGSNGNAPLVLNLQNVPLGKVLELYGQAIDRTLLLAPYFPAASFTLQVPATNRDAAARVLANALKTNGLLVIPDGDKFIMVVPESMKPLAVPRSAKLKPSARPSKSAPTIHAGEIDLESVPLRQVLDFDMALMGRKPDPDSAIPPNLNSRLSFTTRKPLSPAEAIYALNTLLAWNNLKIVPVGKDLARVEFITPSASAK